MARLRTELNRTLDDALGLVRSELEAHAADRRRALHELEERMARRERELTEQAQREEVDAVQRVRAGFEDVSRRQIEQLERAVDRAVASHADEAAQTIRAAREDLARGRREAPRPRARPRRGAPSPGKPRRCSRNGSRTSETPARSGSSTASRTWAKELERRHDELVAAQDQRSASSRARCGTGWTTSAPMSRRSAACSRRVCRSSCAGLRSAAAVRGS